MPTHANEPAPRRDDPVEVALALLDGRWKTLIVWRLFWGARPFCDLMRNTEGITKKTLRQQLAEMEHHGLVHRRLRPGGRRRAEYALTPFGETLKPIVGELYVWGLRLLELAAGRRTASYGAGSRREAPSLPETPSSFETRIFVDILEEAKR